MSDRRLCILIVTYRCRPEAQRLLVELREQGWLGARPEDGRAKVVVVDNASEDGTVAALRRSFPGAVVVASQSNLGFAGGCRLALRHAVEGDVLLLNPDTLPARGSIEGLQRALERDRRLAACGPILVGTSGQPQPFRYRLATPRAEVCRLFPRLLGWLSRPQPGHPTALSGACLLMRRSALEDVGFLDEAYFLYWEETDWCHRAQRAGWRLALVPDAVVEHRGGVSAERSQGEIRAGSLETHYRRSRRTFFRRHHGPLAAVAVEAAHRLHALRHQLLRTQP